MISNSVLYEYAEMNSPPYDSYYSFHFSSELPFLNDFNERTSIFSEYQPIDPFISSSLCNDVWLNDDKPAPTFLTPPRKKEKILENHCSSPVIERLVTKTTSHFIYKDEFLLDVDKELPDVILASPCKENTRQSLLPAESHFNSVHVTGVNSSIPLYDDNLNTSFEEVLKKVKYEMDLRGDAVTYEDIEYLEDLLAGKIDHQPNYASSQPSIATEIEEEIICEDLTTFNEISCNLNSQQSAVSDAQSAIKKLLKNDSFKGNFENKKSTEILFEMGLTNEHLIYEHNYCTPGDHAKPKLEDQPKFDTSIDVQPILKETTAFEPKNKSSRNTKSKISKICKKENSSSHIPKKKKLSTKTRTKESEVIIEETTRIPNNLEVAENQPELCPKTHSNDEESISTASTVFDSPIERPTQEISNVDNKMENPQPTCNDPPLALSCSNEQPNEPVIAKKEKKKISFEEYLKKRAKRSATLDSANSKTNTETVAVPKIEEEKCTNKTENNVPEIRISLPKPQCDSVVLHLPSKTIGCEVDRNRTNEKCEVIVKREDKPKKVNKISPKLESERKPEGNKYLNVERKCSSACSSTFSPSDYSQSLDSCDQYSSSGISSYHNSSVSSLCGSPFNVLDEKSNDTKYGENDGMNKTANNSTNVIKQSPFALNLDLLRKKDHHSSKSKRRKTKRHHKDSKSYDKRKSYRRNSYDKYDSCYEDDSDSSCDSEKNRSRKRYRSTSSSSSERPRKRSHHAERSLSPKTYRRYADWNYANPETIDESLPMPYNPQPNMYYPPPPVWHPEYNFYHPYPYYDNRYYPNNATDTGSDTSKRILYVGNIENGLTRENFCKRFEKFGTIKEAKLHFRDGLSNYGFIYYSSVDEVSRAIEHGNDDPHLPKYSFGFGGRKTRIAGRNSKYDKNYSVPECVPASVPHDAQEIDCYNLKLKQFQNDLQKLTAQSRKYM